MRDLTVPAARRLVTAVVVLLTVTSFAHGQAVLPLSTSQVKSQLKTPLTAPPGGEPAALGAATGTGAPVTIAVPVELVRNRQVSKNQGPDDAVRVGASETTIAVDPVTRKMVVGWNDGEGFGGAPFGPGPATGLSGYGISADAGKTWSDEGNPPAGTVIGFGPGTMGQSATGVYITRGDPWLAFAGANTWHYANLAIWNDQPALPPAGVSVHKGMFVGGAFVWTDAVLVQSPNYPLDFVDKNALAAQGSKVYVTLTNFIEVCDIPFFGFGQMELYRSLDGGLNWSRTIIHKDETFITNPANPLCGLDGVVNQGSAPAVDSRGRLYVAWERGWFAPLAGGTRLPRATIAIKRSVDMGATFGLFRTIKDICSIALNGPRGYNRTSINDFPQIAIGRAAFRDRVFVAFQDCSPATGPTAAFGEDSDIFVAFSTDQGAHWTIVPVHALANGMIDFWPELSAEAGGRVTVYWYRSREVNVTPDPTDFECQVRIGGPIANPTLKRSLKSSLVDVMASSSDNGGVTWSAPIMVNTVTTNWCAATPLRSIIPNFGDYIGADMQTPNVTWADGRNAGMVDRLPTTWYATLR